METQWTTVTSNLVRLSIQMGLFLLVFAYYLIFTEAPIHPNIYLLLTPVLIALIAALGYTAGFAAFILALSVIVFNKIQRTFMDTV